MRAIALLMLTALALALCACSREPSAARDARGPAGEVRMPRITVSGDDSINAALNWQPPAVEIAPDQLGEARQRAARALAADRLYETADDAIPLYLALRRLAPDDAAAREGLDRALDRLLKRGGQVLKTAEDRDDDAREAARIAAVARAIDPADDAVLAYLSRVDEIEQLTRLNQAAERALAQGRLGEQGGGALAGFREVLKWKPGQARARQGVAAVESAMIRRAEDFAQAGDFDTARVWLGHAARVREQAPTVEDARLRVEAIRTARIAALRDSGVRDLASPLGLKAAREKIGRAHV